MKKALYSLLAVTMYLTFARPAFAQFSDWNAACLGADNVPTLQCLPDVFRNVVAALLMFAGTVAVVLIIYAGIQLINSGGDAKKVGSARQIMTYAIIGLLVVLSSFAIIYFISYLTNVKCITSFGFGCS